SDEFIPAVSKRQRVTYCIPHDGIYRAVIVKVLVKQDSSPLIIYPVRVIRTMVSGNDVQITVIVNIRHLQGLPPASSGRWYSLFLTTETFSFCIDVNA